MSMKISRRIWIPCALIALLLFALVDFDQEAGFYDLLRWAVCAGCAWLAWGIQRGAPKGLQVARVWVLGAIAVVFNPIAPPRFERDDWQALDALAVVALAAVAFDWKNIPLPSSKARRRIKDIASWTGVALFVGSIVLFYVWAAKQTLNQERRDQPMNDPLFESADLRAYEIQRRLDAEIDPPNDRRILSAALGRYRATMETLDHEPFEAALRPQRELAQRVRGLFSSPDAPGIDLDSDSTQEDRQSAAAVTHIAHATGLDPGYLVDRWPNVRAEYAQAELGKEDATDGELFAHIAEGYKLDEQLATLGAKAGTQGKLSRQAWAEQAATFKASPAWSEAKQDTYRKRFMEAADRISSRLAPYREIINSTVSDLKRTMGTEDGDTSASYRDMANRLLDVPKKDRAFVAQAIAEIGAGSEADKGIGSNEIVKASTAVAQKLGESVYRGGASFAMGLKEASARSSLLSLRDMLRSGEKIVVSENMLAKEEFRDPLAFYAGLTAIESTGGADIAAFFGGKQPVPLPDDRRAELDAKITRALDVMDLAREIKDIAEKKIDPITSDSLIIRGRSISARTVPMTAGAFIPVGGMSLTSC